MFHPLEGGLIKAEQIFSCAINAAETPIQLTPIRHDHDCCAGAIAGCFLHMLYGIWHIIQSLTTMVFASLSCHACRLPSHNIQTIPSPKNRMESGYPTMWRNTAV